MLQDMWENNRTNTLVNMRKRHTFKMIAIFVTLSRTGVAKALGTTLEGLRLIPIPRPIRFFLPHRWSREKISNVTFIIMETNWRLKIFSWEVIGPLQTWSHCTKLYILVSKLRSGTSKTKAGALFWKSHWVTCSPACLILYHVTRFAKGLLIYSNYGSKIRNFIIQLC